MVGRIVAVLYVATVATLTAYAFSSDEDHWSAEIAAAVLGLPLVVPALPAIYLLGGLAWHGPIWLVTTTFTTLMALVAIGNVLLVRAAVAALLRTRWAAARGRARPGRAAAIRRPLG